MKRPLPALALLFAATALPLRATLPRPYLTRVASAIQAPTADEPERRDANLTPEQRKARRQRRDWLYATGLLLTLGVVALVYRRRTKLAAEQ